MITAERKPLEELDRICQALQAHPAGRLQRVRHRLRRRRRKEVGLLASGLHMALLKSGANIEIREHTLERQCDPEYVEELVPMIDGVEAVMSMACGCGVQELAGAIRISRFSRQ
jgi:hypothetical protein